MNRKIDIVVTTLFIIIIFSVGIIQAITELKKGESVQFVDALEDTFITPVKKRGESAILYNECNLKIASVQEQLSLIQKNGTDEYEQWARAEELAEEAMYVATDLRKSVLNVNRHRTGKPTQKKVFLLDSCIQLLSGLYENIQDQVAIDELIASHHEISEFTAGLSKDFKKANIISYPFLVTKHFIFYTIFNREYLRKYENELEETSVFANTLRPYMQFSRYVLLRDWGEKAIEGRNGWLFYKQGMDYLLRPSVQDRRSVVVDPEDTPIRDNILDSIVAFKNELSKREIELMIMIVPGKASIYPDILSKRVSPDKVGMTGHSLMLMEELNKRGIETVDLFSALAEARKQDDVCGDSLYLSQDTHWKTRGVQVVAKTVAKQIQTKSWSADLGEPAEFVVDTVTIERDGDIRIMADLPDFKLPFITTPFIKEKTSCLQVYQIRRDEDSTITSKNLFRDDYRRSKILILGDSFSRIYQSDEPRSAGWISHLAYQLSLPVCSIVSDGGASTLVREKLQRKKGVLKGKKLVIWEFVERDLRYGAEGWKDIKL